MTVFLEAALRALRVVHFQHQPLSLGRPGMLDQGMWLDRLNVGPGIELADELSVCGQILLELAASRVAVGIDFPAGEGNRGSRTFEFDREEYVRLGDEGGSGRVDLVFQRCDELNTRYGRVYIEVKRARRWTVNMQDGRPTRLGLLTSEVVKDVQKLQKLRQSLQLEVDEKAFFYVLVWGYSHDPDAASPKRFFTAVDALLDSTYDGKCAWRWLPLGWEAGEWGTGPGVNPSCAAPAF